MADVIDFRYAPTLDRASLSKASFKCVEGPVGSGKSTWSVSEVYAYACTIPRSKDGIRRSRFMVFRDTYPNLMSTALETWKLWFKEDIYGPLVGSEPIIHKMKFLDVECEVQFRAVSFDNIEKSIKDLRSLELTGVWGNEVQFAPLSVVKEAYSRTGRFPSKKDCPAYSGEKWMVCDMNAPPAADHWSYLMRGKTAIPHDWTPEQRFQYAKPDDWEFFEQPPAMIEVRDDNNRFVKFDVNPQAENLAIRGEKGYLQELSGRSYNDVRRDLMNKVVPLQKGYPRYTQLLPEHQTENISPIDTMPIIAGYDPGLNGCVHLFQQFKDRWLALHTVQAQGQGAAQLADEVLTVLNTRFQFWKETGFVGWGDPYGDTRFGSDTEARAEDTAFKIMAAKGLRFRSPSPRDNPSTRRELTIKLLKGRTDTGAVRLLIDKRYCQPLIAALDGGCTMMQVKSPDGLRIEEKVNKKNPFADVMEAAEYAFWGGGEMTELVTPVGREKPAPKRYTAPGGRASVFLFNQNKRKIGQR